jgi:hypothetical protein
MGSDAADGRRLAAVRDQPALPEELRLIIAAGGRPDDLRTKQDATVLDILRQLGFGRRMRTKLLAALHNWTPPTETGGKFESMSMSSGGTRAASVAAANDPAGTPTVVATDMTREPRLTGRNSQIRAAPCQ